MFTVVPTKNYAFTPVLYSYSRHQKCLTLICNTNNILLKGATFLNNYKWTDENVSNINIGYN